MSVLVVCTANVSRSPLAARLLTSSLDVPVLSAGARAVPGLPACPSALAFPPPPVGDHGSVLLEAGQVRSASLVLGAAREHRSAAIALVPNVQRKAFTVLQA